MVKIMATETNTECAHSRRYVRTRRVDECGTLHEILTHCLPAFGGAYLRRIYQIDRKSVV